MPSNFLATVYELMGLDLIELRKVGVLAKPKRFRGWWGTGDESGGETPTARVRISEVMTDGSNSNCHSE